MVAERNTNMLTVRASTRTSQGTFGVEDQANMNIESANSMPAKQERCNLACGPLLEKSLLNIRVMSTFARTVPQKLRLTGIAFLDTYL